MAAISSIRKHGVALMLIIGFALLAFILGDLSQVTRTFSNKNIMTKIDGKKMDRAYSEQYEQNTALMCLLQNKSSFDENETYQIHEMTWRQMLQDAVIDKQLKALGLQYNDQMIEDFKADMLASLSTNRPNQYMGQFANALANLYGVENTMAILSNIEDYANNDQVKDLYNAYQAIVRFALSAEKASHYSALVQNTVYFSDPMAKQLAKDNQMALVSLLPVSPQAQAFNGITASVSEKEMKDFYKQHKDIFKVYEKNRDIDVAIFPINPTANDLKAIEDSVRADFQKFMTSPSLADFSAEKGNGSVDSTYYKSEDINLDVLDSLIFKSSVGSYIEPFNYENQKWYFGKVYGGAARPDSVNVATIELPFKTADNKAAKYSKSEAKQLADSLKNVISSRQASIFELQPNYLNGREQTDTTFWLPERGTIAEIYNGLLATPIGGVYVYKAPGGYVVFQVLERTTPIEKRQFVLYDYDITASEATVNAIKSQANQFAASINNDDELNATAAKKGIQTVRGTNVLSMAANIGQLPNCRDIVSWAFSDDVEKDDISDVFNVERMFFAVAAVKTVRNEGVQKFKDVREDIEAQLMAEKKVDMVAEQVKKSLASSSMEALAQQYGTQMMDSVVLAFAGDLYQNRGVDGRAIAGVFSASKNQPTAVAGKNMVYVVNVMDFNKNEATPALMAEKNALRNMVMGRERNENVLMDYLVNNTKVVDNRCKFYQK
ncbi:MAG: SurA N-terminal domain-containing protein [Bacteroidales bacterium]|nr:SurA N-terminal domain-containing protein [Bacteroidales bacterium]